MCEKELVVNVHPDIGVIGSLIFAKMSNKIFTNGAPLIIIVFVSFCQHSYVDKNSMIDARVVFVV